MIKEQIELALASVKRDGIPALLDWLRGSDFYEAPASTRFHLSRPGGLAEHSWNVYEQLRLINERYGLGFCEDSMKIAGLLHDVCKVGVYAFENKRVRSPEGNWSDEKVYVMKDPFPLGHGEKSGMLISQFLHLTKEEALAIRWHMGPWGDGDRRDLGNAMDKCKLLKALMLADQTATWLVEE